MLRHAAALATIALLVTACGAGTGDGTAVGPSPGATPTVSPSPGVTAPTGPVSPSPSPGVALTQVCHADAYTVSYPEGWNDNDGAVLPSCGIFHPGEIVVQEGTEPGFQYAEHMRIEDVPIEQVAGHEQGTRVTLQRRETTVAGHHAVVTEKRATGQSPLVPAGTVIYTYAVHTPTGTLVASTYDIGEVPFETEKQVLDAMMTSLEIPSV